MTTPMTAAEVLALVRRHHSDAAIVPEVQIDIGELHRDLYRDTDGSNHHFRRIDGLMFHSLQRTAIEVKVSREDVKRETYAKTAPWRAVTHRFVYAVPAGLIDPQNMAWVGDGMYGCGIWWVHPDGRVEVKRRAITNKHPEPLPQQVIQRLAYRAAGVPLIRPEIQTELTLEAS